MLLALPGVEEELCFGTPAFSVRLKLLARLKEDGGTLVVAADFDEREALMGGRFGVVLFHRALPQLQVRPGAAGEGRLEAPGGGPRERLA